MRFDNLAIGSVPIYCLGGSMNNARRRFNGRSLVVVSGTVALAACIVISVSFMLPMPAAGPNFIPLLVVVATALILGGLAGPALWHGVGVLALQRRYPDALAFLAHREPALVPDLPTYQYRKDNTADVADRWIPALVDHRGISAWTGGLRPRELLLMEWSELGRIEPATFVSIQGRQKHGVAVDVTPYPEPLLVTVGHSVLGLEGSFDRRGIRAVVDATNARRPLAMTPPQSTNASR